MSKSITIGSLDKELYFGPTFLRGMIYVISVAIFITIFELCFYIIIIVPLEQKHVKSKIQEVKNIGADKLKRIIKNELKSLTSKNADEIQKSIESILIPVYDKNADEIQKSIENILMPVYDNNADSDETRKNIEIKLNSLIDKNALNSQGINSINSIIDSLDLNLDPSYAQSVVNTMTDRELELNYKINNNAIVFIILEIFIFILFIIMIYQKLRTFVTTDKNLNIGYNTHYGAGILPPIINALLTTIVLAVFQINMYFFGLKWTFTSDYEIDHDITKYLSDYLN